MLTKLFFPTGVGVHIDRVWWENQTLHVAVLATIKGVIHTRARRDLVQSQTAAKQRLHDELVVLFPELPDHTPEHRALMDPAVLRLVEVYPSA